MIGYTHKEGENDEWEDDGEREVAAGRCSTSYPRVIFIEYKFIQIEMPECAWDGKDAHLEQVVGTEQRAP